MRRLNKGFWWMLVLAAFSPPCAADIYAYVDGRGVRHISNVPNDARYRLVKKTPQYKKPTQAPPPSKKLGSFASTVGNTKGWKLITPFGKNNNGADQLSLENSISSTISSRIKAHLSKASKPFSINETNRRLFTQDITQVARSHRLEPALLHAVISAESAYNPKAVSHAGAMGLMQLMPATAKRFGVNNPFDPISNMRGGARYLRWLLDRFKNVNLALAAYNAGENAVERYGNKIPPYKETQTYVTRVIQFYNHYRSVN